MAKDYLIMPARSAPAKSLSFHMSDAVTRNGNRKLPESVKMLAVLKDRETFSGSKTSDGEEGSDESVDEMDEREEMGEDSCDAARTGKGKVAAAVHLIFI